MKQEQVAVGIGINMSEIKTLEDRFAFALMISMTTLRVLEGSPFALSMEALGQTIFFILEELDEKGVLNADEVKKMANDKLASLKEMMKKDGIEDVVRSMEQKLQEDEDSVEKN